MADFVWKQNDTTALTRVLTLVDGTLDPNLSGASAVLILRDATSAAVLFNKPGVLTAATSVFTYTPGGSDTAVPGSFLAEIKVTYADASVRSFPTSGYFNVVVAPSVSSFTPASPAFTTVPDVIASARLYLDLNTRSVRNKLAADVAIGDQQIVLKYDPVLTGVGDILCVGLESMYVWEAPTNSPTILVARAVDGSRPSAHSAGDMVTINPRFTDYRIFAAINEELRSLATEGIYGVKTFDLTFTANTQNAALPTTDGENPIDWQPVPLDGYSLPADVLKILDVRWQDPFDPTEWQEVDEYELLRDMPTTVYPTGVGIQITDRKWPGANVRVKYAAELSPLQTIYDDVVTTTGIPITAVDILSIGAALRLATGIAIPRTDTTSQPDPRNTLEVRTSDAVSSPGRLAALRAQRVQIEKERLSGQWVYRRPMRRLMGG